MSHYFHQQVQSSPFQWLSVTSKTAKEVMMITFSSGKSNKSHLVYCVICLHLVSLPPECVPQVSKVPVGYSPPRLVLSATPTRSFLFPLVCPPHPLHPMSETMQNSVRNRQKN